MAEEIKVLGFWSSPFSKRVELALKLKGIEYEYIEEDLSNKSNLLLESNPVHKKIPVLIHEGKPIAESQVILEYIDETWKHNPLLPDDPFERAKARFWAKFIDEKLVPTAMKLLWTEYKEERNKLTEEAHEYMKMLENELKGRDFFGGDTIGLVDIVANAVAFWISAAEELFELGMFPMEKFPVLYGWIDRLLEIPTVVASRPPKEKLLAHMEARHGAVKSSSK